MSRLFESSLNGKIISMLNESEANTKVANRIKPKSVKEIKILKKPIKESTIDDVVDFIADYDQPELRNTYDGENDDVRKEQLKKDIENDKDSAKAYIEEISKEDEREDIRNKAKELLTFFESIEKPTDKDLAKDDIDKMEDELGSYESRIDEINDALKNVTDEDEKKSLEAELKQLKSEYNNLNSEKEEIEKSMNESDKTLKEDSYEKGIFKEIEDALIEAGFDVVRFTDSGTMTYNIGWDVSKNGESTQLNCNGSYLSDDEDEEFECAEPVNESVNVVTSDGSTVNTQDVAAVESNNGSVTVVTSDTTVTINNNPTETAEEIPVEVPEEIPSEDITDEPTELEEVPVEEPIEEPIDDKVEESEEVPTESEPEDAGEEVTNFKCSSVNVLKNQGNVTLLEVKGNEDFSYLVGENYNYETQELDNVRGFKDKESADKHYFELCGVNPDTQE